MSTQPTYAVTGATGELGRRVVASLAQRVPPASIFAIVRDRAKAAALLPAGVVIRQGDYEDAASLDTALQGVDRLLLISSNDLGKRAAQHGAVVDAAVRAGVKRIAYTSILHADRSTLGLAEEHRHSEALIAASGLSHSLLRNGWYTENYVASVPAALQHNALIGAAAEGRIASATRQDFAEAAVTSLIDDEGAAVVHELAGDTAYTLAQFAAELSKQTGRDIPYVNLSEVEFRGALVAAGLPVAVADLLSDSDAHAADDALFDDSHTLSRLIGRPTTPWADTIAAARKGEVVPA